VQGDGARLKFRITDVLQNIQCRHEPEPNRQRDRNRRGQKFSNQAGLKPRRKAGFIPDTEAGPNYQQIHPWKDVCW
jgi:hypothetical protein